jgi:hypothetical protein
MANAEPDVVEVAITVDDASGDRMAAVVQELREAGLEVLNVMDAIGAVSGLIERSRVPDLSLVEGVSGVEVSRDYEIPPPDDEIQ